MIRQGAAFMQLKVNAAWLELIMAGWSALWSCSWCACAPRHLANAPPLSTLALARGSYCMVGATMQL